MVHVNIRYIYTGTLVPSEERMGNDRTGGHYGQTSKGSYLTAAFLSYPSSWAALAAELIYLFCGTTSYDH
jgi:hypothetical protein